MYRYIRSCARHSTTNIIKFNIDKDKSNVKCDSFVGRYLPINSLIFMYDKNMPIYFPLEYETELLEYSKHLVM